MESKETKPVYGNPIKGNAMKKFLVSLFRNDSPSPSYPDRPRLKASGESSVPGVYLAGEVAGSSLIRTGLNEGYDLAGKLVKRLDSSRPHPFDYDVAVVGCGVAGAATGVRLHELGKRVVILEAEKAFQTLRRITRGKIMLAEPEGLVPKGSIAYEESSIEKTLETMEDAVARSGVEVREFTPVTGVNPLDQGFRVTTGRGEVTAALVVLAPGKAGHPRKAGVPGEQAFAEKIYHDLKDPADHDGEDILIYGGGDVAAEAALALCDNNRVTLATVDQDLIFPRRKNVERLRQMENEGRLTLLTDTRLTGVFQDHVTVEDRKTAEVSRIPNQKVFEMIGSEQPRDFFRKAGVRLEKEWTFSRVSVLVFTLLLCLLIYTWKKGYFPFEFYGQGLGMFQGILKNPSFWYSTVYTMLLVGFGIPAMKRWSRNWTDRYQMARFSSLMVCQVLSFFLIECLFAIYLPPDTWWRAYAVSNPFPLLFDSFYNLSGVRPGDLKIVIAVLGALITFVVIPVAVRWHGKRFCSWVCGCGGLAETLGDRWRHLSPKGERSRRWEVMGDLVLVWAFVSALVILLAYDGNSAGSGLWHKTYAVLVDFWLIAVIPMALYPIAGGKIWCRYWCPLAKYMEILSRMYGRLAIVANDRCIQCTQCSLQCQVGVDVMAFAKNGDSFSNKNSSCIHCGICITVCPMDVLSFKQI